MTELNTSNMASQEVITPESCQRAGPEDPDLEIRGFLQKSPHGHEWSVIEPLGILGSEVA